MAAILRVLAVFVALSLGHTAPAAVTRDDIDRFLASERNSYSDKKHTEEVLDLLAEQLPRRGFDAAVDKLAARLRVSREAAALVAEAEIEAQIWRRQRQGTPHRDYEPLYVAALDLAPQSERLWDVVLDRLDDDGTCLYPGMAERYFARSGAVVARFLRTEDRCPTWISKLPAAYLDAPLAQWRWTQLLEYREPFGRAAASARLVERLQAANAGSESPELFSALRLHWADLADSGLLASLLRETSAVNKSVLARTLDPSYAPRAAIEGVDISYRATQDVRDQLTLALWTAGRGREAATLFRARQELPPRKKPRDEDARFNPYLLGDAGRDTAEFIRRILAPTQDDPFDSFVGDGRKGLLWSVGRQTPLSERAAADFFAGQGYADISREMRESMCDARREELSRNGRFELPPSLQALRAKYVAEFKQDWFRAGLCAPPSDQPLNVERAQVDYAEKPLPAQLRTVRTERDEQGGDSAHPSCIENVEVVRCDTSGERWAAVSISTDVDPTGEIGGGGYWLHVSRDRGATWDRPVYLGLQQFQPYVVPATSRLPMLNGTLLQLEVQVRELDPASITFPPVGLRSKREADHLYIERSLADLERDSDGDGLTDLLEDKLRTDPHQADSDNDGLDDGSDPLPGISLQAPPPADAEVIARVFEHVLGYDARAIRLGVADPHADPFAHLGSFASGSGRVTFLSGDKSMFRGLLLPSPVVVLDAADLAYLNARYGIHYPVRFPAPWFNKARTKAVVHWSAGWTGGTLFFTRQADGGWKMQEMDRWIT